MRTSSTDMVEAVHYHIPKSQLQKSTVETLLFVLTNSVRTPNLLNDML